MRHRARKTHRRQAPGALRQSQWRLMWLVIRDMKRWHCDPRVDHSLFAITRLSELLVSMEIGANNCCQREIVIACNGFAWLGRAPRRKLPACAATGNIRTVVATSKASELRAAAHCPHPVPAVHFFVQVGFVTWSLGHAAYEKTGLVASSPGRSTSPRASSDPSRGPGASAQTPEVALRKWSVSQRVNSIAHGGRRSHADRAGPRGLNLVVEQAAFVSGPRQR